jgi:hypothetical protein
MIMYMCKLKLFSEGIFIGPGKFSAVDFKMKTSSFDYKFTVYQTGGLFA